MSDNKPHDPTRWSHTTSELAEARTPPPDDSTSSQQHRDSGHTGSIRSSQYSGTEEDGDKIGFEIGVDERDIMTSSGKTVQNKRLQRKAVVADPPAKNTQPVGDTAAEGLKIDPENPDVQASLSSGNRARAARKSDKAKGDSLGIKPVKDLAGVKDEGLEDENLEDEDSKRDTFGKKRQEPQAGGQEPAG